MKRLIIAAVVTAAIFGLLSPPSATAAQIVNGSFEDGLTGWHTESAGASFIDTSSQWQTDGLQSACLWAEGAAGGTLFWDEIEGIWVPVDEWWYNDGFSSVSIEQVVQLPDDVLTIRFDWLVDYLNITTGEGGFEVRLRTDPYEELWYWNGTLGSSGTAIIDISEYAGTEVLFCFSVVGVVWIPEPPPLDPPAPGENTMYEWVDLSGGTLYLDNVYLSTQNVIPEPATMVLLASALLGIAGVVFKRRK